MFEELCSLVQIAVVFFSALPLKAVHMSQFWQLNRAWATLYQKWWLTLRTENIFVQQQRVFQVDWLFLFPMFFLYEHPFYQGPDKSQQFVMVMSHSYSARNSLDTFKRFQFEVCEVCISKHLSVFPRSYPFSKIILIFLNCFRTFIFVFRYLLLFSSLRNILAFSALLFIHLHYLHIHPWRLYFLSMFILL